MATPAAAAPIELPAELRGERVYLRPFRAADATAVFAAIDESRAHLRPWVGWVDRYPTVETTLSYCERCAATWEARTDLSLAIFAVGSDRFLGGSGLHQPNWSRRAFEISCWVRATAAYQGHGAAALRLLADFAFSRLDATTIKLVCDARNGPTQRLAAKCGYALKGRVRNGYRAPDGQVVDLLVYALAPDDWRAWPPRSLDRRGGSPAV